MQRGCAGVITDGGFSRFRRNRRPRLSRLSPPPERADQSDAASGDRDQRPDRLRRRAGVSGDVILGDSDGVIVIPAHLADEIADEAVEMTAFEDFVTEEVRKGRSILGLYPATDEQTPKDFAAWRKANGR